MLRITLIKFNKDFSTESKTLTLRIMKSIDCVRTDMFCTQKRQQRLQG